jgi:hypothetical protein
MATSNLKAWLPLFYYLRIFALLPFSTVTNTKIYVSASGRTLSLIVLVFTQILDVQLIGTRLMELMATSNTNRIKSSILELINSVNVLVISLMIIYLNFKLQKFIQYISKCFDEADFNLQCHPSKKKLMNALILLASLQVS